MTDQELRKLLPTIKEIFSSISDDVLALFKELSIDRESLNKNVPNSVKRAFKRKISNWQSQGIVKGYFKFKLDNLNKYTYGNILELCIYSIYAKAEQEIFENSKKVFVKIANDCYEQAKEEHPNPPVTIPDILTWAYIYKWLKVLNINATYEEYLQSLSMTAVEEMFKKCVQTINSEGVLSEEDIEKLLDKQSNRVLNINGDKESGIVEHMSEVVGNHAYIDPFPNEKAMFIAEMDERTTMMCSSLNGQIFNTKKTNIFKRYSDYHKQVIEYEIEGLVEGINMPPITDNFHWCRSTMTFQVEDISEEQSEEKIKSFDVNNQQVLKEAIEKGIVLDKINKEKQAKHCDEDENFDEQRSYIFGNVDDAIKLYNKYRGHGEVYIRNNGSFIEYVETGKTVGLYQNNKKGADYIGCTSSIIKIHYSKTGSHLYPGIKDEELK